MGVRVSLKRYLPRTLFGRSLLILIVPVLLIQIITTVVFFDRHWSKMTTRLAYAVSGEIAVAVGVFRDEAEADQALLDKIIIDTQRFLHLEMSFQEGAILPVQARASVIALWENVVSRKLERELRGQILEPFVLDFDFAHKVITVYVGLEGGVLRVSLPQRRLFSSSGYVFLLWMFGVSFCLLMISIVFMRNQIRPIRKLAVAAERFGKGRDVSNFKPEGASEVRQAAAAFLEMRRRIARQISQRTDMLAGVSHDLRTPLTRLKLELEILSEQCDVAAMQADIHDMERMIAGYLDFVRGDGEEGFSLISLSELFDKMIYRLGCHDIIFCDVEPDLQVRVRPLAFERALNNLLINAVKYGDRIWVSAFRDAEMLNIQVEDDGPGIPEALYEDVFKPFKRVDSSRNSETGGVGLGLSIAMDIIQSHGGTIVLSTSEHAGLCASVRLPL